jgi:hypothetical protein
MKNKFIKIFYCQLLFTAALICAQVSFAEENFNITPNAKSTFRDDADYNTLASDPKKYNSSMISKRKFKAVFNKNEQSVPGRIRECFSSNSATIKISGSTSDLPIIYSTKNKKLASDLDSIPCGQEIVIYGIVKSKRPRGAKAKSYYINVEDVDIAGQEDTPKKDTPKKPEEKQEKKEEKPESAVDLVNLNDSEKEKYKPDATYSQLSKSVKKYSSNPKRCFHAVFTGTSKNFPAGLRQLFSSSYKALDIKDQDNTLPIVYSLRKSALSNAVDKLGKDDFITVYAQIKYRKIKTATGIKVKYYLMLTDVEKGENYNVSDYESTLDEHKIKLTDMMPDTHNKQEVAKAFDISNSEKNQYKPGGNYQEIYDAPTKFLGENNSKKQFETIYSGYSKELPGPYDKLFPEGYFLIFIKDSKLSLPLVVSLSDKRLADYIHKIPPGKKVKIFGRVGTRVKRQEGDINNIKKYHYIMVKDLDEK